MSYEVKIIDGVPRKIHKIVVHRFTLGDVEDPDLYAAEPLHKWEHSEQGQFIMSKAIETPEWRRNIDYQIYGYEYVVIAKLYDVDVTYYTLRYK